MNGNQAQDAAGTADTPVSSDTADYLHVFDSRTCNIHHIPVSDGFVRGSDLSTIAAPVKGNSGRMQKLAVLDPGFQHIACKESGITFIDGEKGELRYRGVRIEDLFHDHDFDSTLHLLLWGRLPTKEEKIAFERRIFEAATPPQEVCDVIRKLPKNMDFISMFLTGLSTYMGTDEEMTRSSVMTYHKNMKATDDAIIRCFAYVSATLATVYCHVKGVELHPPKEGLTLVENFLHMIGMEDPDKKVSRTIDRLSINMADHELSCSTAAFLHVASSLTDPMTCLLTAISAASGPLHGGALEVCYQGLELIGSVENVPAYIAAVKAKKFRLFGYGHRVYKTQDPRAALTKELMEEHREAIAANPLLQIAVEIDRQANTDPYFVERKLKLNADFYGCFVYSALGIPRDMIPGLLTISRMGGLMAHWREAMNNPIKIWRPMQKFKL
ncbi:citrate synthase [Decorospora gaudefroyi]|uniref:Citrate synthase n=1 Tax=Decorospora gaudefroyi TaxID=184978 RepID=A0A6A5K4B0_9PLEO|nr:citrate synthase [Decorospora gaudefroyi]